MKQKTLLERIRRLEEAVKHLEEQLGVPATAFDDPVGSGGGPGEEPPVGGGNPPP